MSKERVDKWLWTVRIFKSRTQATDACKEGKIKVDNIIVKASSLVTIGNIIDVKKGGFSFQYEVVKILPSRVGAPLAVEAYNNLTSEEELNKYNSWFISTTKQTEIRERGSGRPTKRERREMDRFKDTE
jgi:ribosome-associated heat shock protein Hsp15